MLGHHKCTFKSAKSLPRAIHLAIGGSSVLNGFFWGHTRQYPKSFISRRLSAPLWNGGREEGQLQSASKGNDGEGEDEMTLDRISRYCGIENLKASRQAGGFI